MADLTVVSPSDLKARYPVFSSVADATVKLFLDDARGNVGPSWIEVDQRPALLAYAAHLMALEGVGNAGGSYDIGNGEVVRTTGALQRIRVGDVDTTFGTGGAGTIAAGSVSGPAGEFGRTIYGLRYWELLQRSFPAVFVV